jgi:hypothetical protein
LFLSHYLFGEWADYLFNIEVAMAKGKNNILLISGIGIGGLVLILLLLALLIPEVSQSQLFATLSELQKFTKIMPESPVRDNKSIVKPEFDTFYSNSMPGFLGKTFGNLARVMGIADPLLWSSKTFANLMKSLLESREKKSYKDNYILHLKTPKKARFAIVGDLQGALHSLVRNIAQWKELDIIGDDLKIKSDTDYIIFLGDAVSRSGYSMETLMILMRFIEKNPEQAFYIRGNHETDNYWQNYGLKRQLEMLAESEQSSSEKFPLESVVQRFFNTLPVALYLDIPSDRGNKFVRFSHEGGSEYTIYKIDADQFSSFLKKEESDTLRSLPLANLSASDDKIETKAIIRSEVKRKSFQSMDGLRQLDPEDGAAAWTVFSSPTAIYQEGVSFFNDAFALLQTQEDIADWVITLYFQDVRKLDGYKKRSCNLLSGEENKE